MLITVSWSIYVINSVDNIRYPVNLTTVEFKLLVVPLKLEVAYPMEKAAQNARQALS